MSRHHNPIDEGDLHALIDGELSPEREACLRERLRKDANAAHTVQQYQALNDRLRSALDPISQAPIPAHLLAATGARARSLRTAAVALVAGLVLGVAVSTWLLKPRAREDIGVVEHALSAHKVYIPEVRHAVEVTANDRTHLNRWLSKRLHHELAAPDLSAHGFTLIGGRLLPDDGLPAAQFMYETASGQRMTIYCRLDHSNRETALLFAHQDETQIFHWVEGGMAYALVSALDRDQLRPVAESAHRQL